MLDSPQRPDQPERPRCQDNAGDSDEHRLSSGVLHEQGDGRRRLHKHLNLPGANKELQHRRCAQVGPSRDAEQQGVTHEKQMESGGIREDRPGTTRNDRRIAADDNK